MEKASNYKTPPKLENVYRKKKISPFIFGALALVIIIIITVVIVIISKNSKKLINPESLSIKDTLSVREISPSNASYIKDETVGDILTDLFPVTNSNGGLEGNIELRRDQDVIVRGTFALFGNGTSAYHVYSAKSPKTFDKTVLEPKIDEVYVKNYDSSSKKEQPWLWVYPAIPQPVPGEQNFTRSSLYLNLPYDPIIIEKILLNSKMTLATNRIAETKYDPSKIAPIYYSKPAPQKEFNDFITHTFKGKASIKRSSNKVVIDIPINYVSEEELLNPDKFKDSVIFKAIKNMDSQDSSSDTVMRFIITGRPKYQLDNQDDNLRIARIDQTANIFANALISRSKDDKIKEFVNKFLLSPDWQRCDSTRLGNAAELIYDKNFIFPKDDNRRDFMCRSEINVRVQRNAENLKSGELMGLLTQVKDGSYYYAIVNCVENGNCSISSREYVKEKPAREK